MTPAAETSSPSGYFPLVGASGTPQAEAAAYAGRWLVADADSQWLSAAAYPALRNVEVTLRFGYLVLRAPGMLRLDIPLDVIEDDDSVQFTVWKDDAYIKVVDEGELAAAWLSNALGVDCRLMKVHPDLPGIA